MMRNRLHSRQQGLTLLEVLIALLVLAIGMAGLGALLLTALTNVHSASQYSLASAIALDFEERLWHEIALQSIDDPRNELNQGCLTDDHISEVAEGLIARWTSEGVDEDWNWTASPRFRARGLNIAVGQPVVNDSNPPTGIINRQQIPLDITWAETRFGLEDNMEQYPVRVTIVCRPVFPPNP